MGSFASRGDSFVMFFEAINTDGAEKNEAPAEREKKGLDHFYGLMMPE